MKLRIFILLLAVLLLSACGQPQTADQPEQTQPQTTEQPAQEQSVITEAPGIALEADYVALSLPADLEDLVQVQYEDLPDGQKIVFTAEFGGEDLELFCFTVSSSGEGGHQLGILTDPEYGELIVCVDVIDYSNGSWTPAEYTDLGAMQERVNDLIVQFHDDPRFTPTR